jgi:hypothetical protein
MFVSRTSRMNAAQIQCMMDNREKMQNMVCRVSEYLCAMLELVDPEIDPKIPLVELNRQEIRYFPTKERQEDMKQLGITYRFVCMTEDHAERMREWAMEFSGQNVNIMPFTCETPYYHDDTIIREEEGVVVNSIFVGGMGFRLQNDVVALSMQWLDALDTVLCSASGIQRSSENESYVLVVKKKLAVAIAERVAIMSRDDLINDSMSARHLSSLIDSEFARATPHAEKIARMDVKAMRLLRTLASNPAGTLARNAFFEPEMKTISYLVSNPPCELNSIRPQLKLDQLARALGPDLDIEVRLALVAFWADNCARHLVCMIDKAVAVVESWTPHRPTSFKSVFRDGGRVSADLAIPPIPFLHTRRCFATRCVRDVRSVLDEEGERVVRIIQCVMEMAGRGFFLPGVVSADVVATVAMDIVINGRLAANMIKMSRDVTNKGFKMATFISGMYEIDGHHTKITDKAICALSMFSCDELETVFDSNGPILGVICGDLTWQTWERLKASTRNMLMSDNADGRSDHAYDRCTYRSFATDALAIALPIVAKRRMSIGVPSFSRQHIMADVLRTIPKAAHWNPLQGTLRLSIEDVRAGHPALRNILDTLHQKYFLVKRVGNEQKKKKVFYEFDTIQLCIMLGKYMNIAQYR